MSSRLLIALVGLVTACGRLGFDEQSTGLDALAGPPSSNVVFVTSTMHFVTAFGSDLAGADAICAARANDAGLPGHYVAWLSTATVAARDRLAGARGWSRTDGLPVADRIDDLVAGRLSHPIRIDEHGEDIGAAGLLVATGTNSDGSSSSRTCNDYTTLSGVLRVGVPWATTDDWTNDGDDTRDCMVRRRLYCFGVDHDVPVVAPTPVLSRRAFVTAGAFQSGAGGIAAADALCASEASIAKLPGTYYALLGTMTTSAASRFDLSPNRPWVRTDGVLVANTPLELMSGQLLAPIAVDATGGPRATFVLTGGNPLVPSPDGSCTGWTDPGVGVATAGRSVRTGAQQFRYADHGCDAPAPLYCLEL